MTTKMKRQNNEINHVKQTSSFDVYKNKELRKASNWINPQPLFKEPIVTKEILLSFSIIQIAIYEKLSIC